MLSVFIPSDFHKLNARFVAAVLGALCLSSLSTPKQNKRIKQVVAVLNAQLALPACCKQKIDNFQ